MKILITGSGGFIGRRIIQNWKDYSGVELYGLTRKLSGSKDVEEKDKICLLECDVRNKEALRNIFMENKFDVVLHLAAITEHNAIVNHKDETFDINLYGTIHILKCINELCENTLFLYASSGKVYGKTNEMPISENAYTNPTTILGKSKQITEQVIDFYSESKNQYLICRIFNVYGEKQKRNFVLPTIMEQIDNAEISLGNIEDLRDYLYIDDLISAFWACIENRNKFKKYDIVNLGSGEPASVKDIINIIEKIINRKLEITIDKEKIRDNETKVEYCNNQKIKEMTGWRPKYSMYDGIKQVLKKEGFIK